MYAIPSLSVKIAAVRRPRLKIFAARKNCNLTIVAIAKKASYQFELSPLKKGKKSDVVLLTGKQANGLNLFLLNFSNQQLQLQSAV